MKSNDILKADLLDIIFENRNKDYGAYTLRKEYNHRMLLSIGILSSLILFFILLQVFSPGNNSGPLIKNEKGGVYLKTIILPPDPVIPEPLIRPLKAEPVATIQSTSRINIRPDNEVKRTTVPDIESMQGKIIGTENIVGKPADPVVKLVTALVQNGGDGIKNSTPEPILPTSPPEFPGGNDALRKFLADNLMTPEDLEVNDKKMVRIRFKVDQDGKVSELDIISSGGKSFDREVIRVCKLMPRWKPALQNGIRVPVSYILPVTFIGVEQ